MENSDCLQARVKTAQRGWLYKINVPEIYFEKESCEDYLTTWKCIKQAREKKNEKKFTSENN